MDVDASNRPVRGREPAPDGTFEIDDVYDRTKPGRQKSRRPGVDFGPKPTLGRHCIQFMDGKAAGRGTWIHGGRGGNWRYETEGCIRIRERDGALFHYIFDANSHNIGVHRATIVHTERD